MDQPTGIETGVYAAVWPGLARYLKGSAREVETELLRRAARPDVSDGELNLLAQLEWQHGELEAADRAAARAVALRPGQSLNAFQVAMVDFAHLRRAGGAMEQWKWQQRTRDAYQRVFELDPRSVPARYYLAYSYMNTPWVGGGNKKKALELSEGGVALGQTGFYAVRADAHRLLGEVDAARADYDTAIRLKAIKLGGLLDAAREEWKRGEWERAKRYLDWAVYCRPDATAAFEAMGDYLVARGDRAGARVAYERAVARDSRNESAKKKLAEVGGGT